MRSGSAWSSKSASRAAVPRCVGLMNGWSGIQTTCHLSPTLKPAALQTRMTNELSLMIFTLFFLFFFCFLFLSFWEKAPHHKYLFEI